MNKIDPCHDTINTTKRAWKEIEGNKLGEAEEDKCKEMT